LTAALPRAHSSGAGAGPQVSNDRSIAVPFVNTSSDPSRSTEDLEQVLELLLAIPALRVIARPSFSFKGRGMTWRRLRGRPGPHVEGSASGEPRRIAAQPTAVDSSQLWSETYDRELTDICHPGRDRRSVVRQPGDVARWHPSRAKHDDQHRCLQPPTAGAIPARPHRGRHGQASTSIGVRSPSMTHTRSRGLISLTCNGRWPIKASETLPPVHEKPRPRAESADLIRNLPVRTP
jgi:TolB-like protein